MYFWRIDKLKAELCQGALPQRQQFHYYLAVSILTAVVMAPLPAVNVYDVVSWGIGVLVTLLGVIYLYRCNSGDRGVRFLERITSISFVVIVRLSVLLVFPVLLAYFLVFELFIEMPLETSLADIVLSIVLEIVVIWRIGNHILQVARNSVA
jgi:hypothetical protein